MVADPTSVTPVINVTPVTDVISVAPVMDLASEASVMADSTVPEVKSTKKGRKRKAPAATENVQLLHHTYSSKKPRVELLPVIESQEVNNLRVEHVLGVDKNLYDLDLS